MGAGIAGIFAKGLLGERSREQEQQLKQAQQALEQQQLGLEQQKEKLNEQLSAPTIQSWQQLQEYAKTLPPDQRAQLMMSVAAPSAFKLQGQQQQVEQERKAAMDQVSSLMSSATPENLPVMGALMQEIANAPDLVSLRQAAAKAAQLAGSAATMAGKPPPGFSIVNPEGTTRFTWNPKTKSYDPGIPGAGGTTLTIDPSGAVVPVGPGASPTIRKLSSTESTEADTIKQALEQINALKPEIAEYAATSGPEPTGTLGKIGAAAERYGEYGAYKFGIPTKNSKVFTDASQLYAQIAGSLTRMGPRSVRFLHELSPHIPKATDSPQLMEEKINKWQDILKRAQSDLMSGPFSPASGAAAPAGGGGFAPRASRSGAATPPPGAAVYGADGNIIGYTTDGKNMTPVR